MAFANDLRRLQTKRHLLDFLGIDEETFDRVTRFMPSYEADPEREFTIRTISIPIFIRHKIPKKNIARGHRIVWEAIGQEKSIYRTLCRRLDVFFRKVISDYPHSRAFGYVRGRNISENAANHCGHKHLMSLDLREFFPSISTRRVYELLISTGMSEEVSLHLSQFLTIDGKLPLGLAPSTVLANAICVPLDNRLNSLALRLGATYSRYADDLSFSGNGMLPKIEDVRPIVVDSGFTLAEDKTRRSRIGQSHYVTGLSVSDTRRPHVPRQKKRRLRQELYFAKKYTLDGHLSCLGINNDRSVQEEVNRLDGLVKFTAFHEPNLSNRLKQLWAEILDESGYKPSFAPKNQHLAPFVLFFDETEFERNGSRFLALGISVSQHQDSINSATREVLDEVLSDVWAAGRTEVIKQKGIHYSDATQDLRLRYVEVIRTLPFEGYVAFATLRNYDDYEKVYLRILKAMIKRRLMAAESQSALLIFEQNDKIRRSSVQKVVEDAFAELRKTNNRRPESIQIRFENKQQTGLSVPDFLLGVLRAYLLSGSDDVHRSTPREKLLFERIRDKYRLILDCDNFVEYSRRRPISP